MAWEGVLPSDAPEGDWIRARRKGIGSSDIGPICGLAKSAWASPVSIWEAKRGGDVGEPSDNILLDMGHALEPVIARWYAKTTRVQLKKGQLVRSTIVPWQLATPDFLRETDDHAVECKHILFSSDEWGHDGTAEIPDAYIVQTNWQMDVLGHDWAHVAAIISGRFRLFTAQRDAELCEMLRERAERFWIDHVLADVRPSFNGSDTDDRYLKQAFKRYQEGLIIPAEPQDVALFEEYCVAAAAAKEAAQRKDELEQQLKARIGDAAAEALDGNGWRFSWKRTKDSEMTDWMAVALALEATDTLIREHTTTKEGCRRIHVSRKRVRS
jgi:putative phage-type endonuclease